MPAQTTGPDRRTRTRDATSAEIKATARARLVAAGPAALTLRAIARDMGLTAPALYRYFGSHEDLVGAVCADVLEELTAALSTGRDTVPLGDPLGRLGATCRAFRTWALGHREEFQLVFASAGAGPTMPPTMPPTISPGSVDGDRKGDLSFGVVFLGLFAEIWHQQPFAVRDITDLPPDLVAQLQRFSAYVGDVLPLGVLAAFLSGWVRLYGAVTVEVFGHLGFALGDPEPMFELMLADMARELSTPRISSGT